MVRKCVGVACVLFGFAIGIGPAAAQKKYDVGATDRPGDPQSRGDRLETNPVPGQRLQLRRRGAQTRGA